MDHRLADAMVPALIMLHYGYQMDQKRFSVPKQFCLMLNNEQKWTTNKMKKKMKTFEDVTFYVNVLPFM